MEFRVLGPLEVAGTAGKVLLPARMERSLLTALLARPNKVVPVDVLIDHLWGDRPPRTAAKTLQTYVSQLRRALTVDGITGEDRIVTRAPGYVLVVEPGEVDALRFEASVRSGGEARRRGDLSDAAQTLATGLALWRGRAYEEFADRPLVLAEAARLEELRLVALEDRVEADLAAGRHRDVIAELEALVAEHPLRERLWGHLMQALYRCGRQADALHAYQRARRLLAEQLGIDPGPELRQLEQMILQHDAALGVETTVPSLAWAGSTTRWAKNGDVHIAYQAVGGNENTLLFVTDWYSNVEAIWDHPAPERFLRRLSALGRLILFDPRGTGLSDPVDPTDLPTLERWMDDGLAVLDCEGVDRCALIGTSAGAAMAVLLAATYPERVESLTLINAMTAFKDSMPGHLGAAELAARIVANWGSRPGLAALAPTIERDPSLLAFFGRYQRLSASPGRVPVLARAPISADVTAIAPIVSADTLFIHRIGNQIAPVEHARALAGRMPTASFVELDGDDHLWFAGDVDELAAPIEVFLRRTGTATRVARVLSTVLVGTIAVPPEDPIGARFLSHVRRQLDRYHGRLVVVGGRLLCTFDGPARAIAAGSAILDVARQFGLDVRAGVHAGEVELREGRVDGVAVDIAAAVCERASPGELLVSRTVVDLVAGSGIRFDDRGEYDVGDANGPWRLFAVPG